MEIVFSENVKVDLDALAKEIEAMGSVALKRRGDSLYRSVTTPAPPPTYPINWDSPRQRAAFFATGGFGGGIPYRRRGTYTGSFEMEQTERQIALKTGYPKAIFIGGDERGRGQSRIHAMRWPVVAALALQEANATAKEIAEEISKIIEKYTAGYNI